MVTETKTVEDPKAEVAEQEATPEAKVLEGTEAEVTEPETLPFKTRVELDAHIEKEAFRRANSLADKRQVTYLQQVEQLKKELRQEREKKEDDGLARLEKKQAELYGADEDLPDFQDAQKAILLRARELKKKETDFDEKYSKATKNVREQQAFTKALELYLVPEDSEEFLSTVKAFATKLGEAASDREMELIYALEEEKLKRLAEAKLNIRGAKPDGGVGSAPGGVDLNKLSPGELIKIGLKKQRK